jgi:hypothetical protein
MQLISALVAMTEGTSEGLALLRELTDFAAHAYHRFGTRLLTQDGFSPARLAAEMTAFGYPMTSAQITRQWGSGSQASRLARHRMHLACGTERRGDQRESRARPARAAAAGALDHRGKVTSSGAVGTGPHGHESPPRGAAQGLARQPCRAAVDRGPGQGPPARAGGPCGRSECAGWVRRQVLR